MHSFLCWLRHCFLRFVFAVVLPEEKLLCMEHILSLRVCHSLSDGLTLQQLEEEKAMGVSVKKTMDGEYPSGRTAAK